MEDYPIAPPLDEARARARELPENAQAQWDLARSIADSADRLTETLLSEALAAADRAIMLAPDDARYHWTKGYLLQRWSARLASQAVESLQRAVELAPDRPKNHFQFIAAQRQAGRSEQAVRYYLGLAKAAPADPMHYVYLAFAYYQARQYAEASATAKAGLELTPDNPFLWYVEGESLVGRGDVAGAERGLRKALECDPSFVDAHYTLMDLLERQERWAELRAEIDALAAKLPPTDPTLPELTAKRDTLPC